MTDTIKIPQVLNASLAASVYICGAQTLGPMAVSHELRFADLDIVAAWCGVTTFLWTTKNFVDDYKAFDGSADQGFSLPFTVFFSALSYGALAVAASSLGSGKITADVIAVYFSILTLWSISSYLRRRSILVPTSEEIGRKKRRMRWICLYPVAAVLSYLVGNCEVKFVKAIGAAVIIIIYIFDILNSRTFSSKNTVAA